ncbi:Os07g0277600, partial [Oryza sativa Japonica Group]
GLQCWCWIKGICAHAHSVWHNGRKRLIIVQGLKREYSQNKIF